jgi:hypothetical protein
MTSSSVLSAIQLAVAPVFMLAAVAAMIGTVATRLARIIDRARELEERLTSTAMTNTEAIYWELDRLKLRGRICNGSVGLLAICAVLIGATVMALFLGETTLPLTERLVPWTFLGAVGIFVVALLFFLLETLLATHALRFGKDVKRK